MSELSHIIYREEVLLTPRQGFNFVSTPLYLEWYHMKGDSELAHIASIQALLLKVSPEYRWALLGAFILVCFFEPGFCYVSLNGLGLTVKPRQALDSWCFSYLGLLSAGFPNLHCYTQFEKSFKNRKKKRKKMENFLFHWVNLQFNVAPVLERRRQ